MMQRQKDRGLHHITMAFLFKKYNFIKHFNEWKLIQTEIKKKRKRKKAKVQKEKDKGKKKHP